MEEGTNVKKIAIAILVLLIVGISSFMLGGYLHSDGGTANDIREANKRIEGRLDNALAKLDSLDKRIVDSQAKVEAVRRDLKSSIDSITVIENRELRNQEILARSEASIGKLEDTFRQIRAAKREGN